MELNREQIAKALQTLEGTKVIVLNREFNDFQDAIIMSINALNNVAKLTEENERLNEEIRILNEIVDYRGSEVLRHDRCIRTLHNEMATLKEDIVRQVHDKLTAMSEFYLHADRDGGLLYVDFCDWIDQVAKEILGEE